MRSAKAYRRMGKWLLHSDCKTMDGVWIASAPFLCSDEDPLNLGKCVAQTLDASTEGVPHPTEWSNLIAPVLELAGVKSWNVFAKRAFLVGIEMEGDTITLTPHQYLGPKEGFEPIEYNIIKLSVNISMEELGAALTKLAARGVA